MEEQTHHIIEMNTATLDELVAVPGIGEAIAQRIIGARPYADLNDLQKVNGIGPAFIEQIRPYVRVEAVQDEEKILILDAPLDELATELPAESDAPIVDDLVDDEIEKFLLEDEQDPVKPVPQSRATTPKTIWIALGSSLLTLILALVLTLGVLAGLNGGNLQYISPAQLGDLATQMDALTTQADTLEQDVTGLRSRLDNLEALSGRVGEVEQIAAELQADVDASAAKLEAFSSELSQMATNIEPMQAQIERQQGFVEKLRDLLVELFPIVEE